MASNEEQNEEWPLLGRSRQVVSLHKDAVSPSKRIRRAIAVFVTASVLVGVLCSRYKHSLRPNEVTPAGTTSFLRTTPQDDLPMLQKKKSKKKKKKDKDKKKKDKDKSKDDEDEDEEDEDEDEDEDESEEDELTFVPEKRCDYIVEHFEEKVVGQPKEIVKEIYSIQSKDASYFYRATAQIFWEDFVQHDWDTKILDHLRLEKDPMDDKTTWTWVTGDQHLSNYGAWRNRHNNVVFSVNDFDEAAIYDFHVDILRLAVSIHGHAIKNGFNSEESAEILKAFCDTYVQKVVDYNGNEEALTYELTTETTDGVLKDFLQEVEDDNTHKEQLEKYTDMKGTFIMNDDTRLVPVTPEEESTIRDAFTSQRYGATMMKTGWHVPEWHDDFFSVLDVARRVGSGVGSFGVDRFYVLMSGFGEDQHILFDVKYEPEPAVFKVLSDDDKAWYEVLFRNHAARAVEAQRRLTSYVDPYTGWVLLDGRPFVVREKSPWKDSPDLDKMDKPSDFEEFIKLVAIETATAHVRGTQGKSPGQFKQVINEILGPVENREIWSADVGKVAESYFGQVQLDYKCFDDFVKSKYGKKK